MNKIVVYIFAYALLIPCALLAQSKDSSNLSASMEPIAKFSKLIPGEFISAEVDVLGNMYLLTTSYQLQKISPTGEKLTVFNDVKKYGNPSLINVRNPLKAIVYYPQFATIVALNQALAVINSINLRNENIFNVRAVATAYDNTLWIFDEQDFKIKKINDQGKVLLESNDMRMMTSDLPAASQLIDAGNQLFLYDSAKGLYRFDYYGAYVSLLPIKGWKNIVVENNRIYGFVGNSILVYRLDTMQEQAYPLPTSIGSYLSIKIANGQLYVLTKRGLEIYSLL